MEGIAYQNKDILFKILGQTYKEMSFAAYGIDLPSIRALLPTDLPKISANEKSVDNLFLLEKVRMPQCRSRNTDSVLT